MSILANELVDAAGLRWLAAELDAHPDFTLVCWVDSVRGVELMTSTLTEAGADRPLDVCVEVGMAGGRTGCRGPDTVDEVARAVVGVPAAATVGVAGYEAALGHDVAPDAVAVVRAYLADVRAAVLRLAPIFESDRHHRDGGRQHVLRYRRRRAHRMARRYLRAHDPAQRVLPDARRRALRPHIAAAGRPAAPGTARVVAGRIAPRAGPGGADDGPPRRVVRPGPAGPVRAGGGRVAKLNDQHAYLRLGDDRVEVGDWLEFGISHPCTVFDKWPMIPVLDDDGRVVDLIRTFF